MEDEPVVFQLSEEDVRRGPTSILRYRREELLGLRDACSHCQEEWWSKLPSELGAGVGEELYGMQAAENKSHLRRRTKNSERRQRSKAKREALKLTSINTLDSVAGGHVKEDHGSIPRVYVSNHHRIIENTEWRNDSWKHRGFYDEEEVQSFQPPAFAVEGEPDFDSGPPQDGWEYLRRVKYEAARCPKVVVAKIDPMKLVSVQTPYMPKIPDIPICSPDMLPSKEWEREFLEDFSLLRMGLSKISPAPKSSERLPSIQNKAAWEVRCFGSITSVPHDDSKEPDIVTLENAESQDTQCAAEIDDLSLPALVSLEGRSVCLTTETTLDLDIVKETPEPSIGPLQLEDVFDPGPVEHNYVIDLSLLSAQVTIGGKLEGPFNEARIEPKYMNGELLLEQNKSGVMDLSCSLGILELEDDNLLIIADILNSDSFNEQEPDYTELECSPDLDQAEHCKPALGEKEVLGVSSYLDSIKFGPDLLKNTALMESIHPQMETLVLEEIDSSGGCTELQSENLSPGGIEDNDVEAAETSPYFEIFELGLDEPKNGDLLGSFGGSSKILCHVDLEEAFKDIENQFAHLVITEPQIKVTSDACPQLAGMDRMKPSSPYLTELGDDRLKITKFIDSNSDLTIEGPTFVASSSSELPGFNAEEAFANLVELEAGLKHASFLNSNINLNAEESGVMAPSGPQPLGFKEVDGSSYSFEYESEQVRSADLMNSRGGLTVEKSVFVTSFAHPDPSEFEGTEPSSVGAVEFEHEQQDTAYLRTRSDSAQIFDHVEFGQSFSTIGNQSESLSITKLEPTVASTYSEVEPPEFDYAELPTTDFDFDPTGFEIYRSGNILLDDIDGSFDGSDDVLVSEIDESLHELFIKVFRLLGVSQLPFIHLLLCLDEVSRATLLRYHVSWLENIDGLPTDRALWFLALSAVVDTPPNAETSAAFRAMLRHCAGVRASMQTRDDDRLYLLNVLITVAGLYFGQAEVSVF